MFGKTEVPGYFAPFEKLPGWQESLRQECEPREEKMQVVEVIGEPSAVPWLEKIK